MEFWWLWLVGALVLVMGIGAVIVRSRRNKVNKGILYERVSHELDSEERDFKAMLEGQELTAAESKQLELIDRYHSNLLKGDTDVDKEDKEV
eukprot:CAMPEP_0197333032 /NCGR_PEP_ID=MMETSP0892-20130614/22966_1 /TAXON_ID=44058 ORGANISM="Aureoumbra lagunensis, Strain CCMP1510" /NCGR_SAMPLE_ID=MMETSP0892 /ASSEMBLY_ACC=CAM_ASM_000538 /LENGTH=91 /DNA_ID=CAMNT_0042832405 /DNA_START=1 /DNA_END=273 /DNA_ORIENTATION=-